MHAGQSLQPISTRERREQVKYDDKKDNRQVLDVLADSELENDVAFLIRCCTF